MRIAIFSDIHLGFQEEQVRQSESFDNARQAFGIVCAKEVDAILMAGDIFDIPLPSPETLLKGFEIFSIAQKQKQSRVKIKVLGKEEVRGKTFFGIPVITIHGTHEYRSLGHTNILELFDASGHLIYLKMKRAVIELGSEIVCIHGFGGVPEKKSLEVLKLWNPVPLEGAVNILVMHQSITEFLPFADDMVATISLSDLPHGFDLIVNGHLHWSNIQHLEHATFLLTGSTVTTQMKKLEGEKPKGVFVFDTVSKKIDFFPLPVQRRLFYFKEKFAAATPGQIVSKASDCIQAAIAKNEGIIPMVRLKFHGTLAPGFNSIDVDFHELKQEFEGKAILSISKEFFSESFKKKIGELRELHASKHSIASIGIDLLEKNLEKTSFNRAFDSREIFELLAEDRLDEAIALLLREKKN